MGTEKPSILLVDDRPDELSGLVSALEEKAEVEVSNPNDVTLDLLTQSDLVLIDYRLEHWPEREELQAVALKPLNGLALAAILRAHIDKEGSAKPPTALAILSAHLAELAGGVPADSREHVIARTHNLEWVFQKKTATSVLCDQFVSLSSAVNHLPGSWPGPDSALTEKVVLELFAIPEESWRPRAIEDLQSCHPPLHELSEWSHGLELVRWLLQRILPYPCFLWDTYRLAARLRVSHQSLLRSLNGDSALMSLLDRAEYKGILAGFLERRWWRAGIESILWEVTKQDPFSIEALRALLGPMSKGILEPSSEVNPVVCVDEKLSTVEEFFSPDSAVRIQPDDWPAYADQAWSSMELVNKVPRLLALVIEQDRKRLEAGQ